MFSVKGRDNRQCRHSYTFVVQEFSDERGRLQTLRSIGSTELPFPVKDFYFASSHYGVFRGLHVQLSPQPPRKIMRIVKGQVLAVTACCNHDCSLRGEIRTFELSESTPEALFVTPRQALGYFVQSQSAIVSVASDMPYLPKYEKGINPSSIRDLPINRSEMVISAKDTQFPNLDHFFAQEE